MGENFRNEIDQILNLDRDHVWISACSWISAAASARIPPPLPIFMTGLVGTLSEKSRRVHGLSDHG